ncbi:hypothetical protein LEP1GSC125_1319 [Leptospira mayottensis 200901122]|uniref:Transposase n=1 Tax=Leptospira mayottensis 200901122 TaxID=1193010 RepID=A0AA87MMD8_9LEPT|nr:hypothetical protein LEP1GSC125_1319 [Leptospira mayottensis 200901122]
MFVNAYVVLLRMKIAYYPKDYRIKAKAEKIFTTLIEASYQNCIKNL